MLAATRYHRLALALLVIAALVSLAAPGAAAEGTRASRERCKDGGWQTLVRAEDRSPFANQGACVSYADGGGTPIPAGTPRPVIAVSSMPASTHTGTPGFTLSVTGEGFQPGQRLYIQADFQGGSSGDAATAGADGTLAYAFPHAYACQTWDGIRTSAQVDVYDYTDYLALVWLASDTVELPCEATP